VTSTRIARKFTQQEVAHGLEAVAQARGDTSFACKLLRELDPPLAISPAVLGKWTRLTYRADYEQVRERVQRETQARSALDVEDALSKTLQRIRETLAAMDVASIPVKELPRTLRELATPAGIFADKSFHLRGQPLPSPTPAADVDGIFEALRRISPSLVVDDEPPDAEVVEEPKAIEASKTMTDASPSACRLSDTSAPR
jgi:hypothetical protein